MGRMMMCENDGSEVFMNDASFKKKKTGTGSEGSCSSSQANVSFDHSDWGELFLYAGDDGYCSGGYSFDRSDYVSDWPEYDSELEDQWEMDQFEEVEESYYSDPEEAEPEPEELEPEPLEQAEEDA